MGLFVTTRWSLVALAGKKCGDADNALEKLCQIYRPAVLNWFLYQSLDVDSANDLTQSFFAKVLEGDMFGVADRNRGRFRTFLSTALRNFYYHQLDRNRAQKRGSNAVHVPYEETLPGDQAMTPEQAFDRQFAKVVIAQALLRLAKEAKKAGRGELFERLRPYLVESPDADDYEKLVKELEMRRNTIAVAIHRMRKRLQELTRKELMDTVTDAGSFNEELRVMKHSLTLLE